MKEIKLSDETVKMYSLDDLSEILHLARRTLLDYATKGKIKTVKIGRCWYLSENNLKAYLNGEDIPDDEK